MFFGELLGPSATREAWSADFADLLVADDEWLRREFDALVAAGWGGATPPSGTPPRQVRWPHGAVHDRYPEPIGIPGRPSSSRRGLARQRAPPRARG